MKSHLRFNARLCLLGALLLSAIAAPSQSNLEAWVRRYNSAERRSVDYGRKVAVDPKGNIIVAGDTDERITDADILIIKYSGAGVPLWTNRYSGSALANDRVYGLGVDRNGNIFVAGSSGDAIGGTNYATLAYSPAGVPLWTNYYNGPRNRSDIPHALTVSVEGNVFVTGYTPGDEVVGGSGFSPDYVTIAYSGTGVPLWTNRYGNGTPSAVAVDQTGNVFVTGSGSGYTTIAYSGAGVALWTNHYRGGGIWESASAIAVDNAGNVLVAGSSFGGGGTPHYATIAYSTAGMALWTNRYPSGVNSAPAPLAAPAALGVDHNGNVFLTGTEYSVNPSTNRVNAYYATVAYSGSGVPLWTNRYLGSGNLGDSVTALAVDGGGNVFVTGYSRSPGGSNEYGTIAYSGAGVPLWTNRYGPGGAYAIAVDSDGNVFVTGSEYATVAYSGAGTALWTNRYDGLFNTWESTPAVAVDQGTGNVYVTGESTFDPEPGAGGSYMDYLTIAYSDGGVALWTNIYTGALNARHEAAGVAVAGTGNVIVTGSSTAAGSGYDYATIAYSRAGIPLWTNRYNGPGNSGDTATAIAVDGYGNVVVTGSSLNSRGNFDYATLAYSAAGVALWTNRYNGPSGNDSDLAVALAVDKTGNVFVTGSAGSGDYTTVAYSRTGAELWTNRYSAYGQANAIAVDNFGRVFVTGGWTTIAYSNTGTLLWTKHYYNQGALAIAVDHIAADHNGNVFVAGYCTGAGSDYATIAYSGAGIGLWTNRYNGTGNANDQANAVMVDKSGNVFVTGYSMGQGSDYDYATIAYSGAGVALWTNRYNGPVNGPDQPGLLWRSQNTCLAIGPNSEVYVTGTSDAHYGDGWIPDFATVKYVWQPRLAIQPFAIGSAAVNLTLSGPQNSSWAIERALELTGSWTNLGLSLLGTNGLGIFSDANPPANRAFYRVTQP